MPVVCIITELWPSLEAKVNLRTHKLACAFGYCKHRLQGKQRSLFIFRICVNKVEKRFPCFFYLGQQLRSAPLVFCSHGATGNSQKEKAEVHLILIFILKLRIRLKNQKTNAKVTLKINQIKCKSKKNSSFVLRVSLQISKNQSRR